MATTYQNGLPASAPVWGPMVDSTPACVAMTAQITMKMSHTTPTASGMRDSRERSVPGRLAFAAGAEAAKRSARAGCTAP